MPRVPLVYLDTRAIQRPLDDQGRQRIRLEADAVVELLEAVTREELALLTSGWLRSETEGVLNPDGLAHTRGVLALATVDVAQTAEVKDRARELSRRGVDPADALHLALAIEGGADYLCTVDDNFLKQAKSALARDPRSVVEDPYVLRSTANRNIVRVVLPHELIYALYNDDLP